VPTLQMDLWHTMNDHSQMHTGQGHKVTKLVSRKKMAFNVRDSSL